MITLRCDGCKSNETDTNSTICYYVVTTHVFESTNFKNMVCPITQLPAEWVDVEE